MWPFRSPGDRAMQQVQAQLTRLEQKVDKLMSEQTTQQADIDAATAAIGNVETTLSTVAANLQAAVTNISAEIAALKAANPAVNTTALNAAVAGLAAPLAALQAAGAAVDALETPAAPPAAS